MDLESLDREELLEALQKLLHVRDAAGTGANERERLLHELQVHQIELEMQNRELREAQQALEESRNRYADLYDFAPAAYFTLDPSGLIVDLNLTAAQLIGRERELATGWPLLRVVSAPDHATFLRHLTACLASDAPVTGEFRIMAAGRLTEVQASSVPALSSGLHPARVIRMALIDITQRKRAEAEREAALEAEQRVRALLEALDRAHVEAAGALTTGGDSGLDAVMRVIARHARSLANARWACLELDGEGQTFKRNASARIEDGALAAKGLEQPRIQLRLAYGERQLAALTVARSALDAPFSGEDRRALELLAERLSSALEIARLQANDARDRLRLSLLEGVTDRLRSVQEPAGARLAMSDVAKTLVPDFADLCLVHLVREDELALHCIRHVEPAGQQALGARLRNPELERELAGSLRALATSHQPHLLHHGAPEPSGSRATPFYGLTEALQTASLIVAPLWTRERLLGVMCFGRLRGGEAYDLSMLSWAQEIAERCASALDTRELVQELREALQWRENLMASISHDLKSPLSAITLSAMSMAPGAAQVERRSSHKQLDLIRRSADHMHHMINDLLSASLLEAGSFRVELRREPAYELAEEACQQAEPLLKARNLVLEKAFVRELPFVFADREPIQRVFANLLGNAAKFTPSGGRVRVAASYSDSKVMFCVSDTGPGIPDGQQRRLFERYWKGGKGAGLGLGLYISKAIIEAHDGRIWVESCGPEGATFCFELPRCDPAH